ncbi:MAG TPA: Gfo/Idh/MocA family oxidoreductase [Caldilineaceae bacterium]|nr:Gfo/Idh/MocA family oxidoreductase [Caldilineaceae bacterium]
MVSSTQKSVRIGVIGVGRMGRNHCRVLSTIRHVTLVGVTDLNESNGRQVAALHECTFYPTVEELLRQVDAVVIASPTPSHHALAMQCMAQGIHILIEKPIAATVAEAEALVAAARQQQVVVQVGHIERFNPAYTELKHVLENIQVAAINFRRLSPYVGSNTDVDVVLDLMIHDLDLVWDLMQQPPTAIHAVGLTAFSGDIDHALAQFTFAQGPIVTVMVSRLTEHKVRSIDVTGLEAYVEGDLLNKRILLHRSMTGEYLHHQNSVKYRQESLIERLHVPMAEPLFLELQHFVASIRTGCPPLVSAQDGLQALRLASEIGAAIRRDLRAVQPASAGATALRRSQEGWRMAVTQPS